MNELLVYQTFTDKDQADRTATLLEQNGITVVVDENPPLLDSNFIGQQFNNPYVVKISGESFLEANKILTEQTVVNINEVDKDYILFTLSNEELKEVITHKEEWGIYNYKLALQILADRNGSTVESEGERTLQLELHPDATPKDTNMLWIVICYAGLALSFYGFLSHSGLFLYLFPQLFLLLFGITLYFSKTTLSNGTRIMTYSKNVRLHGLVILLLTIIILLIMFVLSLRVINYFG
jgi:hypothetical protein